MNYRLSGQARLDREMAAPRLTSSLEAYPSLSTKSCTNILQGRKITQVFISSYRQGNYGALAGGAAGFVLGALSGAPFAGVTAFSNIGWGIGTIKGAVEAYWCSPKYDEEEEQETSLEDVEETTEALSRSTSQDHLEILDKKNLNNLHQANVLNAEQVDASAVRNYIEVSVKQVSDKFRSPATLSIIDRAADNAALLALAVGLSTSFAEITTGVPLHTAMQHASDIAGVAWTASLLGDGAQLYVEHQDAIQKEALLSEEISNGLVPPNESKHQEKNV